VARFFFAVVTAFVKYKKISITARQNLRQYKKLMNFQQKHTLTYLFRLFTAAISF
jgi:hypothetical protein